MTARMLGPLSPALVEGVTYVDLGDRLVLEASQPLSGLASGRFADPSVSATFGVDDLAASNVSFVGFASTQFALPVRAASGERFDFHPAANLNSPPVVMPLLVAGDDGRVELFAPLGAWHEQVIAVDHTDAGVRFRWGWHGDLERVPEGFRSELGIFSGTSVAEVIARWGKTIRSSAGTRRPAGDVDTLLTHLSYWTDNGAAYWYRTEPGRDITSTLRTKVTELADLGVPVQSVELDSWFYPHEISRAMSDDGYLEVVPPTGMTTWTPRNDVLPDGFDGLRQALGDRPLVLHSRHISPVSPYLAKGDWWIDFAAHPVDQSFFRRWFDDAARWGATCIEQDWMMVTFFGLREMRSVPGRALAWQRALDDAASATDMGLLWCMALPGDLAATVELSRVIAVRTSDDYRYAEDPALLWVWYLTVNSLASALELAVFKDCFFSSTPPADGSGSAIDGDPHAELEALLAAMSAGVVGVGDRIGRTDVEVLSRVCRRDGRLVGPDRPITLTDRSFFGAGLDGTELCWASTGSGDWRYLLAVNTATEDHTITDTFDLAALGFVGDVLVYDWRNRAAELLDTVSATLPSREWAFFVCCPVTRDARGRRHAVVGDPRRYATMGRTQVDHENLMLVTVEGDSDGRLLRWSEQMGLHSGTGDDRPLLRCAIAVARVEP